jgi:glucosamine--fructose-6-phosphate aminotransferase (isomerizing)
MSNPTTTAMAAEIAETPDAVERFFDREDAALATLGAKLRTLAPAFAVTCARGSSDHAAAYFAYLLEILAGVPVASLGPSVASIYHAPLRLRGALLISVSQSGKSPDIVALQAAARTAGAFAVAVVNDAASPLAVQADAVLPLHAGPETSVAATKSCITSAAILAALVAELAQDEALRRATRAMPEALRAALAADWSAPLPMLTGATHAYVVGRGPALPVAMEAALKLKETAVLHAEGFSGAEVMHGPLQLLNQGFPVIAFRPHDAAHAAMGEAVARLAAVGGRVFTGEAGPAAPGRLPVTPTGHPLLDPLAMLLSFYGLAEQVARARGHDPDHPSHLRKITETV